jgi:mttA/Hcf106 family
LESQAITLKIPGKNLGKTLKEFRETTKITLRNKNISEKPEKNLK